MTSRAASPAIGLGLAAALLVLVTSGGSGRDPLAALLWQSGALVAFGLATFASRNEGPGALRWALGATACALLASALQANRAEASIEQAVAWILAVLPAATLVISARALGPARAERAASLAVLGASAGLLVVQAAGVLGHPLLGTAGGAGNRPLGTFFDPNHLAGALVLVAAVNAALAGRHGLARAHLVLALIAGLAALATRSRVAALAVAALVVAEAWRRRRESGQAWPARARLAVAAGLLLTVAAGGFALWSRRGEADAWTRLTIWRGAAPAVVDRPVLGLGPAGFQTEWPRFQAPVERGLTRFAKRATTPHGCWLRLPIELGIVGVACLACAAVALVRAAGDARPRLAAPFAAGATVMLAHDALHSPAFVAWLACGLALPLVRRETAVAPRPFLSAVVRAAAVAGALALVARMQVSQRLLETYLRDGDEAALEASLALEPHDIEASLAWADVLERRGDLDAAAWQAQQALQRAPRDAEAALAVARLETSAGRHHGGSVRAERHLYRRAADLAPFDAWVRTEAAAVLVTDGDPEGALAFTDEALALEPHLVRAHAWRVVALEATGDAAGAAAARERLREELALATREGLSDAERRLLQAEPELLAAAGVGPG